MDYSIDIEEIMDEIRRDIDRRDLDDSILEFDLTVTDKRLINQLQFASETALVVPNRKVEGNRKQLNVLYGSPQDFMYSLLWRIRIGII